MGRKQPKILALDPATITGWAHSNGNGGVWDLSDKKDKEARILKMWSNLNTVATFGHLDLLVIEEVRNIRYGHASAILCQTELQGVIKLWCRLNEVKYKGYSPPQIKKFATGKGNAKKTTVTATAIKKWGQWYVLDDNHADALWLLELAKSEVE